MFISAAEDAFTIRQSSLNSPRLPDDLRLFLERYEAGQFCWLGNRFVLLPDPFAYNLNTYVSLRDIVPFRGGGDAFRGYDDCYVLFECLSRDIPGECHAPNLYLGVNLSDANFGWIFLYCPGEFEAQLSRDATYIAKSWSDFMSLVIENRNEFDGRPFWSPENKVISDASGSEYYAPQLLGYEL